MLFRVVIAIIIPIPLIVFQLIFQEFMKKDRQLLSLLQLRKQAQKQASSAQGAPIKLLSSIGLIVDCSNVYKYQYNRDYTQKLKIIDSTSPNQVTQVYLWSRNKQDFTMNIKIGDILFFNNFKIEIYNDSLQAKKAYKNQDSYYRIFSGNPELTNYSPIDKKVGLEDQDGKVLQALGKLRAFSKSYFKVNKVPLLFRQEGKVKVTQNKVTSSDFDVILRVVQSVQSYHHHKLRLTNEKDEFHLGVYKLRSVAGLTWQDSYCTLCGNDYTFFLEIPSWMRSYDPKEWDKLVSQADRLRKQGKRAKIQTKILGPNIKNIKRVTLHELFTKDDHDQQVRVICEIMDIITPFEDALRKYYAQNHTQKSKDSEVGEYIYSIHLLISDQSMAGQVCNVYIYTFDQKGLEFLPELHPKNIYGRNTLDVKEKYDNFVNRLLEETDIQNCPVEIVLSPLFNGKQTIYRIVRTQLLF